MKICPNKACLFRWQRHRAAEYRDEALRCVDCGTLLVYADAQKAQKYYLPPAYRKQWRKVVLSMRKTIKQYFAVSRHQRQWQLALRLLVTVVLLASLGLIIGSDMPTPTPVADRTRWLVQGVDSYRYEFVEEYALGPSMTPIVVEVRKGVVTSVKDKNGSAINEQGRPYRESYQRLLTVEKLFDEADSLLRLDKQWATAIITIEYDPRYGFPDKLCNDDSNFVDFYGCTVISEFVVLK
jgi:hypothetical protein